jgi:hypothetical protein
MKIQGPGKPPDVGEVDKADKAKGTEFADKVEGPSGPGSGDPIAALARDVQAGTITPKQAVEQIVQLAAQKGGAGALPPAAKEKLLAQLEALVKEDPYLAAKAKRIGVDE